MQIEWLVRAILITLMIFCSSQPLLAGDIKLQLFNKDSTFSINNLEFINYVQFSSYNDTFATRLNLGFDLPLIGAGWGKGKSVDLGVASACHLYMFPQRSIFYVDNLYALLTVYFNAVLSPLLSLRLYPVYHLSAHWVDGHGAFENQKISNEMIYLTATVNPVPDLQIFGGYGYYYHVIRDQGIKYRTDLNIMYSYSLPFSLSPFAYVKNSFITSNRLEYGIEACAGIMVTGKNGRGAALAFKYFDQPHPGAYWGKYEKGFGGEILFKGL